MAKDAKNKDVKNKKHFFKDFKAELKKVIWPTPKQIVNNTIADVISTITITATVLFINCFGVGQITFFNSALKSLKKCLFSFLFFASFAILIFPLK